MEIDEYRQSFQKWCLTCTPHSARFQFYCTYLKYISSKASNNGFGTRRYAAKTTVLIESDVYSWRLAFRENWFCQHRLCQKAVVYKANALQESTDALTKTATKNMAPFNDLGVFNALWLSSSLFIAREHCFNKIALLTTFQCLPIGYYRLRTMKLRVRFSNLDNERFLQVEGKPINASFR